MTGMSTGMTNPFVLAQMDAMTTQTPQGNGVIGALENSNINAGPVPPQNRGFLARMMEDLDYMHRRDAAAAQDTLFNDASTQMAKDIQGGATPEVAMMNAFKNNPALLAHPEFFKNFEALRTAAMPKMIEHNPANTMVGANGQIIVPAGQGVANAGQTVFQTTPDGQTLAVTYDMAGRPTNVMNMSEAHTKEMLDNANANEVNARIPLYHQQAKEAEAGVAEHQAGTALKNAQAGYYKARGDLIGGAAPNADITQSPLYPYAKNIAEYKIAPPSPYSMSRPDSVGYLAMQMVNKINPDYDATTWDQKKNIVDDFAKTGSNNAGGRIMRFNAVANHLTLLQPAIDALNNGNLQAFNAFKQRWAQETGSPAPTNLAQIGQIVAQEVQNAIQGNRSGEAERLATAATLAAVNHSPAQLKAAVENLQGFLRGQFGALEQQYSRTGLKDFRHKFLVPNALSLVNSADQSGLAPGGGTPTGAPASIPDVGQSTTINGVPVVRLK